jgi:hypothetical protein
MNPVLLAQIIETLAAAALEGYKIYEQSKEVLSQEDAANIRAALEKAQAATNHIRPLVEAELLAASKR